MSKIQVNAIEPQCGTTLTVGASGDTILIPSGATINNQGSAVNFGPTGAVSWNTTKVTTGFTAVSGVGYFADTTSAAFTITLPATPAAGAVVGIADYANTFATNNVTVARNGSNIGGNASNATLLTNGVSVTFVYVDATQGWIVTDSGNRSDLLTPQFVAATGGTIATCGNYKIHSFTGPGTFTVTNAGNPLGSNSVDHLIVAGGGAGGRGNSFGGGGGAGGYISSLSQPVTVVAYPISIGGGGSVPPGPAAGGNGTDTTGFSKTAVGGGGGGAWSGISAGNGGSGGGGATNPTGGFGTGTQPSNPSGGNGNPGGNQSGTGRMGGGGGAGATGGDGGFPSPGGNGGVGLSNSITGSPVFYAGGGGGGGVSTTPASGLGGNGGGGAGGNTAGTKEGTAGSANTGGGGGGNGCNPSFASGGGGSGIVIVKYKFQ
jgi:hypothetical protein